ncbi:hypothetical protein ACFSQD_18625 [Flavihumibacter stibioxidans]|uniref:Uncharacterized protein n=1 Tax=Flavihumibacter stibioxidans TaxID=1834163 RepID=A0ABR7MC91_9BACT|nr:hypothetical protein [Flavihumibacter stibioxidans]MBC6492572.1 hypothetical protein [Flavihumibacter stibioxidans]
MRIIIIAALFLVSCTAAKVSVPDQFGSAASSMKVTGLNGWMLNQQLTFGSYHTTPVKRGWDFSSVMQHSRISFRLEDQVVKVFNINTDNRTISEKNKMQYTVQNGGQQAAVFAMEKFSEKQLVFKTNQPRWGELTHTRNLQYAFSAAIVLLADKKPEPWQMVMVHRQDAQSVTEEEGYATNGDITISINPLRIRSYTNPKGKNVKVAGGPMFAGYELKIDGGLIGVVDVLDNQVWMINDMDPAYKMVVAAVSSSLLLKRKQDIAN